MDKLSDILKKIMLSILLAVIAAALALVVRRALSLSSYLLALALGALWAGGLMWLLHKAGKRGKACVFSTASPRNTVLAIAIICFVVNLLWVLIIRIKPFSDYDKYWQTALALANGTEIKDAWYIAMYPHILGTASFLSPFIRLFGESVLMVSIINVILTCFTCVLVFYVCLDMADRKTAAIAALLWALCPCKLMMNSLVFSEPLYTCLILLFVLMLMKLYKAISVKGCGLLSCVFAGLLLGALLQSINIVRPVSIILIIAVFIWLVALRGKELLDLRLWRSWIFVMLPLLLAYSCLGNLWTSHVTALVGMEPSSIPIYNIYVGFNESTQGQWSPDDMDLLFSYLSQPRVTPSQAQESLLPLLKERLFSGIDYVRLFLSKLMVFLGNDELGGLTYRFTRPESFVKINAIICNVFYYGVLLLSVFGLIRMFREKHRSPALLLPLYILGLTLAHLLIEAASRYHYSIIPMLCIFAASALTQREKI